MQAQAGKDFLYEQMSTAAQPTQHCISDPEPEPARVPEQSQQSEDIPVQKIQQGISVT